MSENPRQSRKIPAHRNRDALRNPAKEAIPAMSLVEEAVVRVRLAAPGTLFVYLVGTAPFLVGLLYFVTEMGIGANAHRHLLTGSLGMCLLFVWMKACHARFANRLMAELQNLPQEKWDVRRWVRVLVQQATLQSWGLLLIPISMILAAPFGWVFAYYQNLNLTADGSSDLSAAGRRAARLALRFPGQNHAMLALMTFFGLVVFVNVIIGLLTIPSLLKMLFGVETLFSRSGWALMNSTFLAGFFALCWLIVDPFMKAIYVLRCHEAESVESGADLLAAFRKLRRAGVLAILPLLIFTGNAQAQTQPPASKPSDPVPIKIEVHDTQKLDGLMEDVISGRRYQWRLPREKVAQAETSTVESFLDAFAESVRKVHTASVKLVRDFMNSINRFFRKLIPESKPKADAEPWNPDLTDFARVLLLVSTLVIAAIAGVLIYRSWKRRSKRSLATASADHPMAAPDLTDESLLADELPGDEWIRLGESMRAKGEYRLAIRAFYLAGLAHLASLGLIDIARHKSNGDYRRELARRTRGSRPPLVAAFGGCIGLFERVWYGTLRADATGLARVEASVSEIRKEGHEN